MPTVSDIRSGLKAAVRTFWETRTNQAGKQGSKTGVRDTGSRTAVTGGAQMDGFISLVIELLIRNGIPERMLYAKRGIQLPGWFRAEKKWDLIVVDGQKPKAELFAQW